MSSEYTFTLRPTDQDLRPRTTGHGEMERTRRSVAMISSKEIARGRTLADLLIRGRHLSYQRGRRTTHPKTSLIKIEGVDDTNAAK